MTHSPRLDAVPRYRGRYYLLCILMLSPLLLGATRDMQLPDRTDVPVSVYAAAGEALLLWLPSGYPSQAAETPVAQELARLGVEVWQANVLEAHLLAPVESSLDKVPDSDIVALIDLARASGKRVYVLASARAGILALRGVRAWQAKYPRQRSGLAGVILLHPNLFIGRPDPGGEAKYHPAVSQITQPVFIIQPELSPWRWRLETTRAELERGGSAVYTRLLPDVRDRFYFRPDATETEWTLTQQLAGMVRNAIHLLDKTRLTTTPRPPQSAPIENIAAAQKVVRELLPYQGHPQPPALQLPDLDGKPHNLDDHRGRVVLLNFWATWCPPCVHEMPSMQRLKEKMAGRPFDILAVNIAEPDKDVHEFLRTKVNVDFPVLLDRNGEMLKAWKVFAFPTSYLIDTEGRIRYGVYGEIEWDAPETIEKIKSLGL